LVTVFQIPALEQSVRSTGLDFYPVGTVAADSLGDAIRRMGQLTGVSSAKFAIDCSCRLSHVLCRELPEAFRGARIDLVVSDQNEPAAGTVAEHLGLPFINVCPSLPLNREPDIPPPFFAWPYSPTTGAQIRNWAGYQVSDWLIASINKTVNFYRRNWGLPLLHSPDHSFSKIAQLCQMTADFDFPRRDLPSCFHYLGPFCDGALSDVPFPFDRLDSKPLIYSSLGTLQARNSGYFRIIAEACAGLDAQLVISAGGSEGELLKGLPGSPLIVRYAPQLKLLKCAALTITHGGLNTVMQSLMHGVPMVVFPIAHDQPAIAARVARSGAGEVIPVRQLTVDKLRGAVKRVLNLPIYRERAQIMQRSVQLAGGVESATTLIEQVLTQAGTIGGREMPIRANKNWAVISEPREDILSRLERHAGL
jgi:MGT family glycosyltransferase